MIIDKDLRRAVKKWFGSLEPQLYVTHNFGFCVSPETRERSMRRFYNRLQSQVHGRNWNRRDTDQPMIAVGVWETGSSGPTSRVHFTPPIMRFSRSKALRMNQLIPFPSPSLPALVEAAGESLAQLCLDKKA